MSNDDSLTLAHRFLIHHGADPDEILDLLDQTNIDREIDLHQGTCLWQFPDGSGIQARAVGQPGPGFDLLVIS